MRNVIVDEFMSLDGVAQAPGAVDEDSSGSFAHGGWHMQYMEDELAQKWVLESIVEAGGFLLGRRTYEIFAAYWPNASEEEQVRAEPLNGKPKYVVSTTLTEPLQWQNSTLLEGEAAAAVAALKQAEGGDLHVIGSTELAGPDRARPGGRAPADDRSRRSGRRQAHLPRRRAAQAAPPRRRSDSRALGRSSRHTHRPREGGGRWPS